MKKRITTVSILTALVVLAAFLTMSFSNSVEKTNDTDPAWKVPGKYKSMKNPYASDKSLKAVGKTLYAKHCKSCHGTLGKGNGSKAAKLEFKKFLGDFTSEAFHKQSDGVIFYKSIYGFPDKEMPNFTKKIPDDEDQWAIIMYMKSLKGK